MSDGLSPRPDTYSDVINIGDAFALNCSPMAYQAKASRRTDVS